MSEHIAIKDAIMAEATWVHYDSWEAQIDMRQRCADTAAQFVKDLEQKLELSRTEVTLWMEMYTDLQKKYEDFVRAQAKPWLSDPATGKEG